jgi:hypothetical protein
MQLLKVKSINLNLPAKGKAALERVLDKRSSFPPAEISAIVLSI